MGKQVRVSLSEELERKVAALAAESGATLSAVAALALALGMRVLSASDAPARGLSESPATSVSRNVYQQHAE